MTNRIMVRHQFDRFPRPEPISTVIGWANDLLWEQLVRDKHARGEPVPEDFQVPATERITDLETAIDYIHEYGDVEIGFMSVEEWEASRDPQHEYAVTVYETDRY